MLPIQMAIPVILQVLNHLLGGPFNPPWGFSLRTLVPTQNTEILGFAVDNSASVVVRERLFGVPGSRFRFGRVAIFGGPRVGLD